MTVSSVFGTARLQDSRRFHHPTSPVGYDLRFFCSSCHVYDVESHDERALTDTTEFGKTDCTTCHSHVGPNAVFGNGM
jgi:hypothetical protein